MQAACEQRRWVSATTAATGKKLRFLIPNPGQLPTGKRALLADALSVTGLFYALDAHRLSARVATFRRLTYTR